MIGRLRSGCGESRGRFTLFLAAFVLCLALPDIAAAFYGGQQIVQPGQPGKGGGQFSTESGMSDVNPLLPYRPPSTIKAAETQAPEVVAEPAAASRPPGRRAGTVPAAVARGEQRITEPKIQYQEVLPGQKTPSRAGFAQIATGFNPTMLQAIWSNPQQSVEHYGKSLQVARTTGDLTAEAQALTNLGGAHLALGRFGMAEEFFTKALQVQKGRDDKDGQANALMQIGATRIAAGHAKGAVEVSQQALALFQETKNAPGQAQVLNNVGVVFRNTDNYRLSAESMAKALAISSAPNAQRMNELRNYAAVHKTYANYDTARKAYDEALFIAKMTGDFKAEAEIHCEIADMLTTEGRRQEALKQLGEALDVLKAFDQPANYVLKLIGDTLLDMGDVEKAGTFIRQAKYDSSLGRYHLAKKDYAAAERHFKSLIDPATKAGRLDELFAAYTGLGNVAEARGDLPTALRYYEQGMKVVEDIRAGLLPPERKNFYAGIVNGFPSNGAAKGAARIAMKQNKPEASIYPSELTRARGFTDNISARTDIKASKVPTEILEKDVELQSLLASLEKARDIIPRDMDPERFDFIVKQIEKARNDLRSFVDMLWQKHKNYAAARHPRPIRLADAAIRPDEHVAMYDILGDGVAIRLLKGNKIVKAVYVPWKAQELEKEIWDFRKPFDTANLGAFNADIAGKLYQKLLAPVLADVPKGTPLTIVPDGILALLPFEALVTGGKAQWKTADWGTYPTGLQYVSDEHPIAYYQSLTALTVARTDAKKTQATRVLVVADPVFEQQDARSKGVQELQLAEGEKNLVLSLMNALGTQEAGQFKLERLSETAVLAKYIDELYKGNADVFTGLDASKKVFLSKVAPDIKRYAQVVFATHGLVSNSVPGLMEPALALSLVPLGEDGFLTMTEVMGLDVDASLAALTACQTGVGQILAGEGVMSMGRAFQAAGAKTVLMSLWSVSETGAVKLVEQFFKNTKEGKPKAVAWEAARKELRAQGFDHPFFWAPFILVGESD